jgi:hypothetical protein
MRKMNRWLVLLLALAMLGLAGCGDSKSKSTDTGNNGNGGNGNGDNGTGGNGTLSSCGLGAIPGHFGVEGVNGGLRITFSNAAKYEDVAGKYDLWYGTANDRTSSTNTNAGTDLLAAGGNLVTGTITGLTNGTTYYVWVNTIYEGKCQADYYMETGTPVPTITSAPTGLTATAGEESIDVTWNLVEFASGYEVAYSTVNDITASGVVKQPVLESKYKITGLANGTEYYIWVSASNTNGSSPYSAATTAIPEVAIYPPSAVGPLLTEGGAGRLKVTWGAVDGATAYKLYYNTSNDPVGANVVDVAPAIDTVSASITGLTNDATYYVWVKAVNSAGSSENFSPTASGKPQKRIPPINFANVDFALGEATAEFIDAELRPFSPFVRGNSQGPWDRLMRGKETPISDLFADGALWYLNEYLGDPAEKIDFVFLNSGYLNFKIDQGAVTVGGLMGAVSSGSLADKITLISLKGSDVKALFDFVATQTRTGVGTGGTGNLAMVSKGVEYTLLYKFVDSAVMQLPDAKIGDYPEYDANDYYQGVIKPGTLKLNGAAIDDNKTYRIATTDFVANGGTYLLMATKGFDRKDLPTEYWHAVAEYIYDARSVTPTIDGRIKIEGGAPGGKLGVAEGYNQYCPANSTYDETKGCIFQ